MNETVRLSEAPGQVSAEKTNLSTVLSLESTGGNCLGGQAKKDGEKV